MTDVALVQHHVDVPVGESRERSPRDGSSRGPSRTRDVVLWCGGEIPEHLELPILGRGWRIERVTPAQACADVTLAAARALIVELPDAVDDVTPFASPLIEAALGCGIPVVLTMESQDDHEAAPDPDLVHRFVERAKRLTVPGDARLVYRLPEWGKIAQWIEQHLPGPPPALALRLKGDLPTAEEPEAEMLLRRAFHDADEVTLTRLTGGKSGAAVWSAVPRQVDGPHRASPFLVKYNSLRKNGLERSRYCTYADESVSFRLRPPLHASRCVEAREHGLLVFDFIDCAVPFRAALQVYPAAQLIGSLFGHTLFGCLRTSRSVTASLVEPFTRVRAFHWSPDLDEAAAHAFSYNATIPSPEQLRFRLASLPPVLHRVATAHSDLHTGNLLVAAGSSDVLLIDFGSIESSMPVVTDAACLEVSITFPTPDAAVEMGGLPAPAQDADWLRAAYAYPLRAFGVRERYGRDAWVADAVKAIRGASHQEEPASTPYPVAVSAYLIRYASYADNGTLADRALAYELAAGLLVKVSEELGT